MSDEQQQAAIGRTVEEYVECKKKLAALLAESNKTANELTQLGQLFRSTSSMPPNISQYIATLPTQEHLAALVSDINLESARRRQLFESLRNMGFEPKD